MSAIEVLQEIAPGAEIHPDARIGRWCVIGPKVKIGPAAVLADRVMVTGNTTIGSGNHLASGTVVGAAPQDLKYRGGDTLVIIGDNNIIRRNVTINCGTEEGGWITYIGSNNIIGQAAHVAHDCYIADDTKLGAKVLLAGHVVVQDDADIADMTGVHHFVRLGIGCKIGARTPVTRDVPPYTHYYSHDYYWDSPEVRGINPAAITKICKNQQEIDTLSAVLDKLFFSKGDMGPKLDELSASQEYATLEPVTQLVDFCRQRYRGKHGRYREQFRGQLPPEASQYVAEDILTKIREEMNKCQ